MLLKYLYSIRGFLESIEYFGLAMKYIFCSSHSGYFSERRKTNFLLPGQPDTFLQTNLPISLVKDMFSSPARSFTRPAFVTFLLMICRCIKKMYTFPQLVMNLIFSIIYSTIYVFPNAYVLQCTHYTAYNSFILGAYNN